MGRVGVLLLNLGGPEQPSDVRPFLYNLFSDPEIIRLPFSWLQKPLAWLIATSRAKTSQENYKEIGGGSPLRRITEEQASALSENLKTKGKDAEVYIMSDVHGKRRIEQDILVKRGDVMEMQMYLTEKVLF